MDTAQDGDLIMLIAPEKKHMLFKLQRDAEMQTHQGVLRHNDIISTPYGSKIFTHLNTALWLLRPTLRDILIHTKRRSQIIFPKDIGYILLRLSIRPGSRVLEAGTGSGALTTALAWAVGSSGNVYTYDRRNDLQSVARKNLEKVDMLDRVTFYLSDISEGFHETEVDALFLDVPDPHNYLPQVRAALRNGGEFGALLPTTTQVSVLLEALSDFGFLQIDVCEILLRFYKPIPARLRPADKMIAHTGYLVFARPDFQG
ncbi:MAG: tRNA (adenine-N1)-methyltransferase [Anaerolineales bacterium]|nr:tRNA (adenine-N1)-methyltransferase [Anaerolineales bacterium]